MRRVATYVRWLVLGGALILISLKLPAGPLYKPGEVKSGGIISGKVMLLGQVPGNLSLEVGKDKDWCGRKKQSPRFAVGKGNGVRNAIVSIIGVTSGKKFEQRKYLLDQRSCEYDPHVLLLAPGGGLQIVNSDATLHNVHASGATEGGTTIFNIAQPVKGFRLTVKPENFKTPGLYALSCDAGHPWMSGYIAVMDHPYYALTDADGKFTLTDIPPGAYKLKMWHEGVNVVRTDVEAGKVKSYAYEPSYEEIQNVVVEAGGKLTVNFEFSLRPAPLTAK